MGERSSASAGVFQSSVFRGRELRAAATAAISLALCMLEIGPFGEVLAQQSVSVLVGAALPGAGIAEMDSHAASILRRACWSLGSLIPSQRPARLLGQRDDRARGARRPCRLGAMTGECGPVLHAADTSWPWPAMRGGASSRVKRVVRSTKVPIAELPKTRDKVSFPVAHGCARSAASAGRWLIMISRRRDEGLASPARARLGILAAPGARSRPSVRGATRFDLERTALDRWAS